METPGPKNGIEVAEDMEFQRRSWRAQKWGRGMVFGIVLAGMLGAFGGGGLAEATTAAPDGSLTVEHRRCLRNHADARFIVRVSQGLAPGGRMTLWVSRELARAFELERTIPEAKREWSDGERLLLEFEVSNNGPAEIQFHWRTRDPGWQAGEIGLAGHGVVRVSALVFP